MIGEIKEVPITTKEKRAVLSLTLDELTMVAVALGQTRQAEYNGKVEDPYQCHALFADIQILLEGWLKEQ